MLSSLLFSLLFPLHSRSKQPKNLPPRIYCLFWFYLGRHGTPAKSHHSHRVVDSRPPVALSLSRLEIPPSPDLMAPAFSKHANKSKLVCPHTKSGPARAEDYSEITTIFPPILRAEVKKPPPTTLLPVSASPANTRFFCRSLDPMTRQRLIERGRRPPLSSRPSAERDTAADSALFRGRKK